MNMIQAIRAARDASGLTEREVGDQVGMSAQCVHNKIAAAKADIRAGNAVMFLDAMGYQLAVVPKGKRLPQGSIVVDEWERHGNAPSE